MAPVRRWQLTNPLFSVIIPTWNRPVLLAQAIRSVLGQTIDDFECIVVNDAGAEPSDIPVDDRISVIGRSVNGGPAAARNTGLAVARAPYVAFLDDDDIFTPERLEIALSGLARAPLTLCAMGSVDGVGSTVRLLEGGVHDVILNETTPHLNTVAVRTEMAPRFDERYDGSEDLDWWLRVTSRVPVTTDQRVGCLWRRHAGERGRAGTAARLAGSRRLLIDHAQYFASHRRAHAFRWRRIGIMELSLGHRAAARAALVRSIRLAPTARAVGNLTRTLS